MSVFKYYLNTCNTAYALTHWETETNREKKNVLAVQLPVVPVHCWLDATHLSIHDSPLTLQRTLIVSCETTIRWDPCGTGGWAQPNTTPYTSKRHQPVLLLTNPLLNLCEKYANR